MQNTSGQNVEQSKEPKKKGGIVQSRLFWIMVIIPTGGFAYYNFTTSDYLFAGIFGLFAVIAWFQFLKLNAQKQKEQGDGDAYVQQQHSDETVTEEVNIRPLRRG